MKAHATKIGVGFIATIGALVALALATGPSGSATSRIPELGDADAPKKSAPAPVNRRALAKLAHLGSGPCGPETYAIVVDGRRKATVC